MKYHVDLESIVKSLKEWVKDKDQESLAVLPVVNFIKQYDRR